MAFVPHFKHDIFVSYAHADNQPRVSGEAGWIDDFHGALLYQLGRRMGKSKSLDIWRDDTLRGNDDFADAISGALDETALMICIMSPSYLESDWCKREFREFSSDDDPIRVGEQYRIFKVEPIEVNLEEQPELLQRLLGYRFYDEKDPPAGLINEYRAIQDDYRYWSKLDRLCRDIADLLKAMVKAEPKTAATAQPKPKTPPPSKTADPSRGSAVGKNGPVVYLSPVTYDLEDDWYVLKNELESRDVTVVPDGLLPNSSEALISTVSESLSQADLAIHMVGEFFDRVIGDERSSGEIQYEMSLAEVKSREEFRRMIWIPRNLDMDRVRANQQDFLVRIDDEIVATGSTDVLKVEFEDFKEEVLRQLPGSMSPALLNYIPMVYFTGHPEDLDSEEARKVCEYLLNHRNYDLIEATSTDDERREEAHIEFCDGVVIFSGKASTSWVKEKAVQARALTMRRRDRPLAAAVFNGPPAEKDDDLGIRFRTVEVLDGRRGFRPSQLRPFCERLEQGRGS